MNLDISRDFQVVVANHTKWDSILEAEVTTRLKEVMSEIKAAFPSATVFENTVKLRGDKSGHVIKAAIQTEEVVILGRYFAALQDEGRLDNTGIDCLELLKTAWVLMNRPVSVPYTDECEWMGEHEQIVYACLVI